MKAQRRHDLQQSDLAKVIKGAPTFWQQSGGRYLLGLIAVLVIAILIRYRINSTHEAAGAARENLAIARTLIDELHSRRAMMMDQFSPPNEVATRRKQLYGEANNAIADATRLSDDRTISAEALVARGDLHWSLATLPPAPGAATQAALTVKDPKDLMLTASDAYKNVLDNFGDVPHAAIAARFGLAAIAENKGDWDAAKAQYEAIAKATNNLGPYQAQAAERLNRLPELKNAPLLAKPATEPVLPPTTAPELPPGIAAPKPATTRVGTTVPATPATTQSTTTP